MKSPVICSVAMVAALVGLSPVARALDQAPVMTLDLARKMASPRRRRPSLGSEKGARRDRMFTICAAVLPLGIFPHSCF